MGLEKFICSSEAYCIGEIMHPNIAKFYIIFGSIISIIWVLFLLGILRLDIVGLFLLIIFTALFLISVLSNPPGSGFRSGEQDRKDRTRDLDWW